MRLRIAHLGSGKCPKGYGERRISGRNECRLKGGLGSRKHGLGSKKHLGAKGKHGKKR
jgi:hypothetical protein